MERKLSQHLTNLFWAVAQACDSEVPGEVAVPDRIRKAFEHAMRDEQVLRLYGKLLDKENGAYTEYGKPEDLRDE